MTVQWDLSPREFETRVQTILRDYARRIIQELSPNIGQCPNDTIQFGDGRIEIMHGFGSDVTILIGTNIGAIMNEAFEDIHELWQQQYPGMGFAIEDDVEDVNLSIHLNGFHFADDVALPDEPEETLYSEVRVRDFDSRMADAQEREDYETAAVCKASILKILEVMEARGFDIDFDGLNIRLDATS